MTIQIAKALSHATSMLMKAGVPESNAAKTARAIVTSDVWGNPSHGLMRLPFYLQRITMGGDNA